MSEWQPIDTAPEGQCVLLGFFDDGAGEYTADNWYADCWVQLGRIIANDDISGVMLSLVAGAPNNDFISINSERIPTHWMPLPEPPND